MSANLYKNTHHHFQEDSMLYTHRSQTLKFHISHVHVRCCNLFHSALVLSVSTFSALNCMWKSGNKSQNAHLLSGFKFWFTRTKLHAETKHYWENLRKCLVYLWGSSLLCLWLCSNHTDTVCWQSKLYHIKVNVPNSRRRFMYCVVFTLYRLVNSNRRLDGS